MKKFMKRIKITTFNVLMLVQLLISGFVLGHDLFIWGIKPLFTGQYLIVTYFGMFVDFLALAMFYGSFEYFKELFK